MIQTAILLLLKRRHFWRYASFGEVASLYIARFMRQTAGFLVSIFVIVFMYQSGYALRQIALFYIGYFCFKLLIGYFAARYAARYGPKHGMFVANLLSIPALLAFSLLEEHGGFALLMFLAFQGSSMSLYTQSHDIDFSKVKNARHAGTEIGVMYVIDKVAAGLSPLLGGLLAWWLGPEVVLWLAACLYAVAALPLLRTAEPVRTRQRLRFYGFPWRTTWRSFVGGVSVGIDASAATLLWPLFLAAVIFAGSDDSVYAKVGGLASISIVTTFVASWTYGKIIDRKKGGELLRHATVASALMHLARPLVTTPVGVGLVNIMSDTASSGYLMAFTRGEYDLADRTGHRNAYLYIMEACRNIGFCLIFVVLYAVSWLLDDIASSLSIGFVVAAGLMLGVIATRFPLYRSRQ